MTEPPYSESSKRLLLPRVSAVIAEFVKPINATGPGHQSQLFQRFTSEEKKADPDQKQSKQQQSSDSPADDKLPDNVIPFPTEGVQAGKALAEKSDLASKLAGSGAPILNVLLNLKQSPKLIAGLGRMLYARMRKDQDKSKLRKGVIVDHKV